MEGPAPLAVFEHLERVEKPWIHSVYGLVSTGFRQVGQLLCGFQGHEDMIAFEQGRMFLRCVSCGHESPGWDVTANPKLPRPALPRARIVPSAPSRRAA